MLRSFYVILYEVVLIGRAFVEVFLLFCGRSEVEVSRNDAMVAGWLRPCGRRPRPELGHSTIGARLTNSRNPNPARLETI